MDLSKLAARDWGNVCSKGCCAFTAGICAHAVTAMAKKKGCNVHENMKEWEQLKAATELYEGEFVVSTYEEVLEDVSPSPSPLPMCICRFICICTAYIV